MGVALVLRVMDFPSVVKRARELHTDGLSPTQKQCAHDMVVGTVYGRICSSESRDSPPTQLTSSPGRKTAFLFGPDAITSVILKLESYQAIRSLGFTKEYVKHEVGLLAESFILCTLGLLVSIIPLNFLPLSHLNNMSCMTVAY